MYTKEGPYVDGNKHRLEGRMWIRQPHMLPCAPGNSLVAQNLDNNKNNKKSGIELKIKYQSTPYF